MCPLFTNIDYYGNPPEPYKIFKLHPFSTDTMPLLPPHIHPILPQTSYFASLL